MSRLSDLCSRAQSGDLSHAQLVDALVAYPYRLPSWLNEPRPPFSDYTYDEAWDYTEEDTFGELTGLSGRAPLSDADLVSVARRCQAAAQAKATMTLDVSTQSDPDKAIARLRAAAESLPKGPYTTIEVAGGAVPNDAARTRMAAVDKLVNDPQIRNALATRTRYQDPLLPGRYTPDRIAEQRQIVAVWLSTAAANKVPDAGQAIVMGGVDGAGKTTVRSQYADSLGITYDPVTGQMTSHALIDADYFKDQMIERGMAPVVEGLSPLELAPLIHEESSAIAKMAQDAALRDHLNLIVEKTLANEAAAIRSIKPLTDAGYDYTMSGVNATPEEGSAHVLGRYARGLDNYALPDPVGNGGRVAAVLERLDPVVMAGSPTARAGPSRPRQVAARHEKALTHFLATLGSNGPRDGHVPIPLGEVPDRFTWKPGDATIIPTSALTPEQLVAYNAAMAKAARGNPPVSAVQLNQERRQVMLRDEESGGNRRCLWAYMDDGGNLHIDGQDLGSGTRSVSNDGEYEWFTTVGAVDLPRLLKLLGAPSEVDVLDVLEKQWSGSKAGDLEAVIRDSDIKVQVFTWSG